MSRFFPHTPYAEDQPLAHTILTGHVVARTITVGTLVSAAITTTRHLIPSLRPKTATAAGWSFTPRLARSASTGTLIGIGLGLVMTAGRMRGREEIEWQDRSWRLLENRGQVETDDWTAGGVLAGAVAGGTAYGLRGAVGGVGLGSVAGMVGYLAWRYGLKGGKFGDEERSL